MDFDSRRCFSTNTATLHFRAASKQVGLSSGTFSGGIRRIEEALGVCLFGRTTRKPRQRAAS